MSREEKRREENMLCVTSEENVLKILHLKSEDPVANNYNDMT